MRLNMKLLIAAICVLAGLVILWRSFAMPQSSSKRSIPPTIQIVAEPSRGRATLVVNQPATQVILPPKQLRVMLRVDSPDPSNARGEIMYSINGIASTAGIQPLPWSLQVDIAGAQPITINASQVGNTQTIRCTISIVGEPVPFSKNESNDIQRPAECQAFGGEK